MSAALARSMKARLAGRRVSGATIHFAPDDELPDDLIEEIVRARIAENARSSGASG